MDVPAIREALIARLGRFPERVPLEPVSDAPIDEGAYTRTRVTYMVEAGERIPAWLLVPNGPTPQDGWPAILAIHQHGGQFDLGKSELVGLAGDPRYASWPPSEWPIAPRRFPSTKGKDVSRSNEHERSCKYFVCRQEPASRRRVNSKLS